MIWERATLGSLIKPVSERSVPDAETELAYIGMEHVEAQSGRVLDLGAASKIKSSSPLVKPGDVLYGRLRPYLNKVAIAPREVYASGEFIVFRGNARLDAKYLKWRLTAQDFVDYAVSLNAGDRPRVKWPQMAEFKLSVPLLEEQRRIVAILEDHLSRLDAADASLSAGATRADSLAWRIAEDAVKQAGGQPVALDRLGTVKNGIYVSRPGREPVGVPILRIGAIRPLVLDLGDLRYSKKTESEVCSMDGIAGPGDVLFTRYNGNAELVGACAVVPDGTPLLTYPDKLIRLRFTSKDLVPEFVAVACSVGSARVQIRQARKTSAGQVGIAGGSLKKVMVRLPDKGSQLASVRKVREARESSARLISAADETLRRSAALRRSLLAAAFSGQLTGSGPHV